MVVAMLLLFITTANLPQGALDAHNFECVNSLVMKWKDIFPPYVHIYVCVVSVNLVISAQYEIKHHKLPVYSSH